MHLGQTILFLHIPKAAGTTLNQILSRQYSSSGILTIHASRDRISSDELGRFLRAHKKNAALVSGHMYFGVHQLLQQPSTYITFLRNPVERIVSHFHYVTQTPDHYLHDVVRSRKMTLTDYVTSGISVETDNGQTRQIAGTKFSNTTTGIRFSDVPFGGADSSMLASAKKNLSESFSIVGLAEKFDTSLILLKRRFGWSMPYYVKANVTKDRSHREELSNDAADAIKRHNKLDIELYEHAKKLFEQQVDDAGPGLEDDLRRLEAANRIYGTLYPVLKYPAAVRGLLRRPKRLVH